MKQDYFMTLLFVAILIPIIFYLSKPKPQDIEIIIDPRTQIIYDTTYQHVPGAVMKWRNDSLFTDDTYKHFVRILKKEDIK